MKPFLIAANWKMQRPHTQTIEWCTKNKEQLTHLSSIPNHELAICPTFTELHALTQLFKDSRVRVGAQDCSAYDKGAYTGHVDAQSLKEVGCKFCIIGHSERRRYNNETNDLIAHKLAQLIKQGIEPIVCIGETKDEYQEQKTFSVLEQQLAPILNVLKAAPPPAICIAYEPVWAIGTGLVPKAPYLDSVFTWLADHCAIDNLRLLYGGSVNPQSAGPIKQMEFVDGFLVGSASLDIQKLEKIVSL